ncbi:MaoC family dehydratase [Nocardioides sp. HDW12B]|uniref:MaoC family dehydratase n=1 Tax=Nocardioides sp. HDW12B TaxID=2714939 RepID=UPI00140A0862|nr:MaoC family dehydratase [Nocardioides sp. HDW12B]QIK65513.1 MaoC family dehydratase [Nocardioides sp. HDW12B]
MRSFTSVEELENATGEEIGPSDWITVDQERVNAFADATGDHQWIHVDVERAKDSPFGGTIVHGYLTLSLLPLFTSELFTLDTPGAKLNYGTNKVRFPAPLPVGSKVRATATIAEVSETKAGTQLVTRYTIETEGSDKPACVAETVVLLLS